MVQKQVCQWWLGQGSGEATARCGVVACRRVTELGRWACFWVMPLNPRGGGLAVAEYPLDLEAAASVLSY